MKDLQTPFRYDFVGSFLRPQALKDAKAAYQSGKIDEKELDRVTEEEIRKVVGIRLLCDYRWRVPENVLAS